jgi:hypothetical protein
MTMIDFMHHIETADTHAQNLAAFSLSMRQSAKAERKFTSDEDIRIDDTPNEAR